MPVDGADPPTALVRALRRLLIPLVRVLISHNVGFPYLCNLLKGVYVETASRHFRLENEALTNSRISVLTGVHRKDVKRLREEPSLLDHTPRAVSFGARIIGIWTGLPEYLDKDDEPRALRREEFEAMVQSVSKDVRPRTILDEWLSQGLVELNEEDELELLTDAFIPSEQLEEMAYYFGRNLHDHIAAAGSNLAGATPPYLERAVFYGGLRTESVTELEGLARKQAQKALKSLNQATLRRVEKDKDDPEATHRFCFGVYSYHSKMDEEKENS